MNPSRPLPRLAFASGRLAPSTREIAEEVPVAFTYRGSTQAVMMASPADLRISPMASRSTRESLRSHRTFSPSRWKKPAAASISRSSWPVIIRLR